MQWKIERYEKDKENISDYKIILSYSHIKSIGDQFNKSAIDEYYGGFYKKIRLKKR